MEEINNTQFFNIAPETELPIKNVIKYVCDTLRERAYDPVNQLSGYLISGDPTYITSHNGARNLIAKVERDELIEEILKAYIMREMQVEHYESYCHHR